MKTEVFDSYVIGMISIAIASLFIPIGLHILLNYFSRIKKRLKLNKMQKQINKEEYQDLIDSANRKIQLVNKQILSLDRCSKEIERLTEVLDKKTDSFIHSLYEKLLQYRETATLLKEIDESIQKSVSVISENTLMKGIEGLTGLIDQKMDSFIQTIENNALKSENMADLLKEVDTRIHLLATNINESAIILEKRDRELKEEISCLLSLEGKTNEEIDYLTRSYNKQKKNKFGLRFNFESELAYYLDYPINVLPIPQMAKNALKDQFECVCIEDVLSMMLLKQRRGMLTAVRHIGKKSITDLEDYLCETGLLIMVNRYYTSPLSM